ncbi:MAG: diaminopimelate epimerase [Bacteroides sp.]|nr:diaminopimelate epimerase [Bacteroides sp.]
MIVQFSKYHGTGNDFIMIDGRDQDTSFLDHHQIYFLCHRRFGIGSDGLIILRKSESEDFKMSYYNADGHEGSMCGNGGRCITAFARDLGIISMETSFEGIDGKHSASLAPNGEIRLKLKDVDGIRWMEDGYFIDTGSPHFIKFVTGLDELNVEKEGREIRMQSRWGEQGVNVNFVELGGSANIISVRTYERGVENETYSCGTGVSAAAICSYYHNKSDIFSYHIHTLGGNLNVSFRAMHHTQFSNIHLSGPAIKVFDGSIELKP